MLEDATTQTIAAISTARGLAAISLIRVSGELASQICNRVFRGAGSPPDRPRTLVHGKIMDPDTGDVVDTVLAAFFSGPNSYTGEDMLEIHTHGGRFVTTRVFQTVTRCGARPALPGEFTMRAFANGKLDLTQAEAVLDVIHARNDVFLKAAQKNLSGNFGNQVLSIHEQLVNILSSLEVVFEYPDENVPDVSREVIADALKKARADLKKLINSFRPESMVNKGMKIALLGRPNVGKSSIMNRLAGFDRSIIHESPGTTRDLIGESVDLSGLELQIMDTAGITSTENPVESEGVRRTKAFVENEAHEVILVFDGSQPLTAQDFELMDYVLAAIANKKNVIPVLNKSDLPVKTQHRIIQERMGPFIAMSALTGQGADQLTQLLHQKATQMLEGASETMITSVRHKTLLENALASVDAALAGLELVPQDILCIDIRESACFLGEIIGRNVTDDILESIFSNFCVGK